MIFRLDRFFFDEKDVATFIFGVLLVVSYIFSIPLAPFKFGSLVALFVYLLITRSLKSSVTYEGYFMIAILGLFFSLFLSPYGLGIFLLISTFIYIKSKRV
ncbi:hypothetical protein IPM65_06710 [Candidatus Roizmanbacteria bacterium]|nr:MAG: hypothetical protein IPM65_06710 [Candidatus Roizmanbacteria bacterium]